MIHSVDKPLALDTKKSIGLPYRIIDKDVASMYPAYIANFDISPLVYKAYGFPKFVQSLMDQRLEAKNLAKKYKDQGDMVKSKEAELKSDSLKITINSILILM